jgi:hypothetical protein
LKTFAGRAGPLSLAFGHEHGSACTMGFSLSWLAIRGKDSATVRSELGVYGTGRHEDVPDSPLLGADLPTGWYLVLANRCDLADALPLAELSSGGEVVTCFVEEHVMYSRASFWKDGRRVWSITHDLQRGSGHLETEGELPPVFTPVRDRLSALVGQDRVDYIFYVPVEVAKALTGFRHDEDIPGAPDEPYERLEKRGRVKKWWEVWR